VEQGLDLKGGFLYGRRNGGKLGAKAANKRLEAEESKKSKLRGINFPFERKPVLLRGRDPKGGTNQEKLKNRRGRMYKKKADGYSNGTKPVQTIGERSRMEEAKFQAKHLEEGVKKTGTEESYKTTTASSPH